MKAQMKLWTVVALLALLAVGLWVTFRTGLDGTRLEATIRTETARVQARLEGRFDQLDQKVDGLEARIGQRLDRLESKIDRLIELATPHLPDGMECAP